MLIIRKLTRLTLRMTEKDLTAMLYLRAESLNSDQRAFLAANGVTLTEGTYDYAFPAFYEERDIAAVRDRLGDSIVAPATSRVI